MYRLFVAIVVAIGLLVSVTPARTIAQEVKEPSASKEFRKPDVIYVPTPHEVVEKMLDMAKVEKGDVVYDLGCGDGRIVVAAAKRGARRPVGTSIRSGSRRRGRTSRRTTSSRTPRSFRTTSSPST